MTSSHSKAEKITITVPLELKEQVLALKNEFKSSVSSLYKDAMQSYIKQIELQKWEKGAKLASQDKEYMNFVQDLGSDAGEIYEY